MASAPVDPLQTLQAALSAQANSNEQAELLATLRDTLEKQPAPIPILVKTLIGIVVNAGDSLLKRWVIDLLHFAICRSTLSLEQRTQMSLQALDTIVQLVGDPNPTTVKLAIQSFTSAFPLLFRYFCANRNNAPVWNTINSCKSRIIAFVWSDTVSLGVKLCAMKLVQRVILVQTRGISDPRLLNKADPSLSMCPADHPFLQPAKLEAEGRQLLEAVFALLYQSKNVDLLCAMVNSWSTLAKLRPAIVPMIVTALKSWTPAALKDLSFGSIKSVEKTIRILLVHISRIPNNAQYVPQITEYLSQQASRMEKAVVEEKKRRLGQGQDRKRPPSSTQEPVEAKRVKLEAETVPGSSSAFLAAFDFTSLPASLITELIIANLSAFTEPALVELVQTFRQNRGLPASITAPSLPASALAPPPPSSTPMRAVETLQKEAALRETTPQEAEQEAPVAPEPVKAEPVDPLKMDIDQDEMEYEPDRINEALSGDQPVESTLEADVEAVDFKLAEFKLPQPKDFSDEERTAHIQEALNRIREGAEDLMPAGELPADAIQAGTHTATELWMLLLVRMITRISHRTQPPADADMEAEEKSLVTENLYARQDEQRQVLCDYIMGDFPSRIRLANTWMNEEWYNDQIRLDRDPNWRPNYETWLNQIVSTYQTHLDGKDKTFSRFLLDLPYIPADVLELLRDLCLDSASSDRLQVGFTTLRGLVIQRPSLRTEALTVLLELTTHSERRIRAAAINSVKHWVSTTQPMDGMIRDFALQMLRKLQASGATSKPKTNDIKQPDGESDSKGESINSSEISEGLPAKSPGDSIEQLNGKPDELMENGQPQTEPTAQTPYIPEQLELPAQKPVVLQHVELLFALSVKVPEFLDEIFSAYGQMDVSVQEAIQDLITALVRSLGPSHGKLLTLLRTCPPGSESLALRVLTIFTDGSRASSQLVAIVKALVNERNLDARFLIPIIAEMDKPDILRHLPKIVSLLNGQPEPKNLVRSVFSSIVTTPPQTFGSVTSNLPRVRQSELLTPAELMVLLHESEKEIGLKSAIEAIGICFSMTDVFRSEILAVVMQQIMDEPTLPVLFLRTVIQAVTTYKSLVGFVSTTLLSRLITKKIWTNPPLWEGFIRCAKVIAPASFGALLQLPKDQLRELVDKQPSLKSGLRDFVTKKAPNKARVAGFLDIFGEAEDTGAAPTPSSGPVSEESTPEPAATS